MAMKTAVALLNQIALMVEGEMRVAMETAGGSDMAIRKGSGDRLHEQLRILRSIDAGLLDLENAVLVVSLCATTKSFSDQFDYQNESSSVNQSHCRGSLQPILETAQATIKAISRFR